VLVVEDDPGIATQLVRGLERAGYAADSVAMGAEALRRPPSDVVLLDLGLPDVDGIDVCRRLRADSDAAIIVVTARGEEAVRAGRTARPDPRRPPARPAGGQRRRPGRGAKARAAPRRPAHAEGDDGGR